MKTLLLLTHNKFEFTFPERRKEMLGLVLLSSIAANSVFLPRYWASPYESISTDFAILDYDNDGDLDLVFCDYAWPNGASVQLYNNANGVLTGPVWVSSWLGGCNCITAGDYDNDGYIDIAIGTVSLMPMDGHNVVFRNLVGENPNTCFSTGAFTAYPSWTSNDCGDATDIRFADIDKDGWLELMVANRDARIRVYDNSSTELNQESCDPFNTSYGAYSQTDFCISTFFQNLYALPSFDIHLICQWGDNHETRVYNNLYDILVNAFIPSSPIWISNAKQSGQMYSVYDLNGDYLQDWISFDGRGIIAGLSESNTFSFNVVNVAVPSEGQAGWIDMKNVVDLSVASMNINNPNETYIALANRGYMTNSGVYTQAEDRVYKYVCIGQNASIMQVWASDTSEPTLAIGMYDLNEKSTSIQMLTVNYVVSCSNQTFVLPHRINRIVSVTVNGQTLPRNCYHIDNQSSYVSLIGNYTGNVINIVYTVSSENELICATVGRNRVYYHE